MVTEPGAILSRYASLSTQGGITTWSYNDWVPDWVYWGLVNEGGGGGVDIGISCAMNFVWQYLEHRTLSSLIISRLVFFSYKKYTPPPKKKKKKFINLLKKIYICNNYIYMNI